MISSLFILALGMFPFIAMWTSPSRAETTILAKATSRDRSLASRSEEPSRCWERSQMP